MSNEISNDESISELKGKNKEFLPVQASFRYADLIIPFIGLGIIIMTSISILSENKLPAEFLFGATLSSFFLALSEMLLIEEKVKKSTLSWYGFLFYNKRKNPATLP